MSDIYIGNIFATEVVDLVSFEPNADDYIVIDDINNPNIEPWFHIMIDCYGKYVEIITRDGIAYYGRTLTSSCFGFKLGYLTAKAQSIIQKAIKNYVNEL